MEGKLAGSSRVSFMHRPLPEELNHAGFVYGGNILRHMDAVGSMAAIRYARSRIVTAAVEYMTFRSPVSPNEIMHFHASVNGVWNSSMEVGIRTEAEEPFSGSIRHVCTCYMTFVALDDQGKPRTLPPILPENEEDARRMADATRRMAFSRIERHHEAARLSGLTLEIMPGRYAVCKLSPLAPLPDFSLLPPSAFASLSRTEEETSLVLKEDHVRVLQEQSPGMEVFSGFACLKVLEKAFIHKIGVLAGLTTILASARVAVYSVSTYNTCYLLFNEQKMQRVTDRLKEAGHTVLCRHA